MAATGDKASAVKLEGLLFSIAQALHRIDQRRWQGTIGLASLPSSNSRGCELMSS